MALEKYDSLVRWMGIIVLAIAILPLLGIGGMQLFSAEVILEVELVEIKFNLELVIQPRDCGLFILV